MLLSDIRTSVRYRLRETSASVWTDAELNNEINIAQRIVAKLIKPEFIPELFKIDETGTTVVSQEQYNLPSDFLKMAGDAYIGGDRYLFISSIAEIMRIKKIAGNDIDYQKKICYLSQDKIGFFPVPTVANNYSLPYIKIPAALSSDTDESELNDTVLSYVIDIAAANAMFKVDVQKSLELKNQTIQILLGSFKNESG